MEKGDTAYILIYGIKMQPYKIHIVEIIDDKNGDYIVYKWYGKHKQWWHFALEDPEILQIKIDRCKEWRKKHENI